MRLIKYTTEIRLFSSIGEFWLNQMVLKLQYISIEYTNAVKVFDADLSELPLNNLAWQGLEAFIDNQFIAAWFQNIKIFLIVFFVMPVIAIFHLKICRRDHAKNAKRCSRAEV